MDKKTVWEKTRARPVDSTDDEDWPQKIPHDKCPSRVVQKAVDEGESDSMLVMNTDGISIDDIHWNVPLTHTWTMGTVEEPLVDACVHSTDMVSVGSSTQGDLLLMNKSQSVSSSSEEESELTSAERSEILGVCGSAEKLWTDVQKSMGSRDLGQTSQIISEQKPQQIAREVPTHDEGIVHSADDTLKERVKAGGKIKFRLGELAQVEDTPWNIAQQKLQFGITQKPCSDLSEAVFQSGREKVWAKTRPRPIDPFDIEHWQRNVMLQKGHPTGVQLSGSDDDKCDIMSIQDREKVRLKPRPRYTEQVHLEDLHSPSQHVAMKRHTHEFTETELQDGERTQAKVRTRQILSENDTLNILFPKSLAAIQKATVSEGSDMAPLQDRVQGTSVNESSSCHFFPFRLEADNVPLETQVVQIVGEMEKDGVLMENNPLSEHIRLELLKEMAKPLTMKRRIRRTLKRSVKQRAGVPIGLWTRLKYGISMSIKKLHVAIKDMFYGCELWYSSIKMVEGHYGSGVATYFKFLRWLFSLNLSVFLISFIFIVVPQLAHDFNIDGPSTWRSLKSLIPAVENYSAGPTVADNGTGREQRSLKWMNFDLLDIVTGQGYLNKTILFYGSYSNASIETFPGMFYNIPKAYFFTTTLCYLLCLCALSVRMAQSYRKCFIETAGGMKNIFAQKVFCGWDFSIATVGGAVLKSRSIYNELRELLNDDKKQDVKRMFFQNVISSILNGTFHILSLAIVCGVGMIVWYMLNLTHDSTVNYSIINSLCFTVIIMGSPLLFSWLIKFELQRNPRRDLYMTLLRTFLLNFTMLGVLVIFWLKHSHDTYTCWETSLGEEIYRLVILDFFIALLGGILSELVYKYISQWKNLRKLKFHISSSALNLIYNQSLLFFGMLFSPLLPAIMIIKMFITFHIKKMSTLKTCEPSVKSWRAAQTETVFLALSFLSLVGVLTIYGYLLPHVSLSDGCGPFVKNANLRDFILNDVFHLCWDCRTFRVIIFFYQPGVIAGFMVAMCTAVYYLRAQCQAHIQLVTFLQEMLILQSKDREFLLKHVMNVTEGKWIYGVQLGKQSLVQSIRVLDRHRSEKRGSDVSVLQSAVNFPSASSM